MFINKLGYDFLSKENTLWLHGVLAICVFACHIPSYLGLWTGTALGSILQSFGGWAVALFFFLSGFGLFSSYEKAGGGLYKRSS